MHWAIEVQDRDGLLAAATAAAPYCHVKLNSVDMRVSNTSDVNSMSDEELQIEIAKLERKIRETLH